jgi:hypothetical protein
LVTGSGWGLVLASLLLVSPAQAKKKSHASDHVSVPTEPSTAEPSAAPPEAMARASGDESFGGEDATTAGTYTLRTLIQTRFVRTAPDFSPELESLMTREHPMFSERTYFENLMRATARDSDGLHLERVFLRATAAPTRSFSVKLLVDFGELVRKNQKKALKLAFGELHPTKAVTVTAGLFKIPFSLLELLPIADYEFADVGPTDNLIKDLGFAGRDVGAMVDVAPLRNGKLLHLQAAIFDGDNDHAQRHVLPAMLAARITSRPLKQLRLGVDCAYRPHAVSDTEAGSVYERYSEGGACSADAALAFGHFGFRGEWMAGKRTDTPSITDHGTHDFMAAWAVASYRLKLSRKMALLPALRAEWLDEDQPSSQGQTTYLTAAMNLELSASARLLFDLSRSNVQVGTRERGAAVPTYKPSANIGVVQVQFKL